MQGEIKVEDQEDRWPRILANLQLEAKARGLDLAVQAIELDDSSPAAIRVVRARYCMIRHGAPPAKNGQAWHVHFTSRWGRDA